MEKKKQLQKSLPWFLLVLILFFICFAMDDALAAETPPMGPGIQIPAPTETGSLSCTIDGDNIIIQGTVAGDRSDPAYYDNYLYLFQLDSHEDGIGDRTDYTAWINRGDPVSFVLPLGFGTEEDRLFSSFVLAVFDGTSYHAISKLAYISNPEAIALNRNPYQEPFSKKGLTLDGDMLSDAMALGVANISVSMTFEQLLGEGIDFTYKGKTYHFNKETIESFDENVSACTRNNINVTAVLVNGWNDAVPALMPSGIQRVGGANYYMFNASTKEGAETLEAIVSFLALRYSGMDGTKGKISNWIIGNEINNQVWNYAGPKDITTYVQEFIKGFRICYTAIKSVNSNDHIFFSTDFYWKETNPTLLNYAARDVIDLFAQMSREGGDMDWGLAYHPYPDPMTEPEFWDDGEVGENGICRVTDSVDSYIVNFKNLHVLTDYFKRQELLKKDGGIRHIILSEQGFSSQSPERGDVEQIQAAALAYAYYIADSNPYIDSFLLHRQVDNVSETNINIAVGLWRCDMSTPGVVNATGKKKAWEVYRDIDKKKSLETVRFAKGIIGIGKWSDVIPGFKWKAYE